MRHVYLLQSIPHPEEYYVGVAEDFEARLTDHNEGGSKHTAKFRPWKAVVVIRFHANRNAFAFDLRLKSSLPSII